MRTVFLDTVGLLALWDNRDQWHAQARHAYAELIAQNVVTVTSEPVLLECGNAASRLQNRAIVALFRSRLIEDDRLLLMTPDDLELAWVAYKKFPARGPGIVDCISFQLMGRFQITDAFTNDQHFREAGFITLF